jgi:hypothetical protein
MTLVLACFGGAPILAPPRRDTGRGSCIRTREMTKDLTFSSCVDIQAAAQGIDDAAICAGDAALVTPVRKAA